MAKRPLVIRLKGTISDQAAGSAIVNRLHERMETAGERFLAKNYRGAVEAWEEAFALAEMEGVTGIESLMGEAYLRIGEFEKAVRTLETAVTAYPADVRSWSNLGLGYSQMGRQEEGIAALTRAIEIEPGDALGWSNLAVAERRLGREEPARKSLLNAVRCDPKCFSAWKNLGNSYRDAGDFTNAAEAYQRAVGLCPGRSDVWSDLGAALSRSGRKEEGSTAFRTAVEVAPEDAFAWFNFAMDRALNGDVEGMKAAYKRLKSLDPVAARDFCQEIAGLVRRLPEDERRSPVDPAYWDRHLGTDPCERRDPTPGGASA